MMINNPLNTDFNSGLTHLLFCEKYIQFNGCSSFPYIAVKTVKLWFQLLRRVIYTHGVKPPAGNNTYTTTKGEREKKLMIL